MWWSNLAATTIATTWTDEAGYTAVFAPVILMNDSFEAELLIGDLSLSVISATATEMVLRIEATHAPITTPDFVVGSQNWLGVATTGAPVPGLPMTVDVTLGVGLHTIGIRTHYTGSAELISWPDSYRTMIIEVA